MSQHQLGEDPDSSPLINDWNGMGLLISLIPRPPLAAFFAPARFSTTAKKAVRGGLGTSLVINSHEQLLIVILASSQAYMYTVWLCTGFSSGAGQPARGE